MSRSSTTNWRGVICSTLCGVVVLLSSPLFAQEVEIRRWNHLPIDGNFVTTTYARTDGEIAVDPVLLLDDVSVEMDTWLLGYIRTFELFDRTARVEIRQPWQAGIWNGVVDGTPTQVSREGWSDTFARFAVNLVGHRRWLARLMPTTEQPRTSRQSWVRRSACDFRPASTWKIS